MYNFLDVGKLDSFYFYFFISQLTMMYTFIINIAMSTRKLSYILIYIKQGGETNKNREKLQNVRMRDIFSFFFCHKIIYIYS